MEAPMAEQFDIAVVGGGLAGATASVALARRGLSVAAIAPKDRGKDGRTTALLASSVDFLRELEVWDDVAANAAPLATMRIIDATNRLFRAPETAFHSSEIGLPAFGYNVANAGLVQALSAAAEKTGKVRWFDGRVEEAEFSPDVQRLKLSNGHAIECRLVVGADGRGSAVRHLSGTGVREWSYPQTALVLDFAHTLPHHDASTEFHTPEGPFTCVPLGDRRSSLVWVQRPDKAKERIGLPKSELAQAIEGQMHSILGKVEVLSDVQAWPLSGMIAHRFGADGFVLVGEAGHAFPPIGAQGFNLGLRDVALLDRLASRRDPARLASVGGEFSAMRFADVATRTLSVDVMNRSLLSSFVPVQMARAAGMHAISAIGPLRRLFMREGVAPGGQLRAIAEQMSRRA
jgi:2-octaprenyl-6-methoxyphenol hydroxylase